MTMDEITKAELESYQGAWDQAEEESGLKSGKQLLYIEEMRVILSRKDGSPFAVFTVKGAEEDNKGKSEDVFFRISQDAKSMRPLKRFLKSLKITPDFPLMEIEERVRPIYNRVFEAEVDVRKGTGDRVFVNIYPKKFVETEVSEDDVSF